MRLRGSPAFVRFWLASTVSDFGTYVTTVALSVLVLLTLGGSALDQGWVNAARWAPYLLFGLFAGLWVDRYRRRPVLIAGDLGRGLILASVALLAALGRLELPLLMALLFAFGTLALAGDAAHQSFLPHLVPRPLLTRANARLEQSTSVAQTAGGALAGGLVSALGAPLALAADALSHLFSAAVLTTVRPPSGAAAPVHRAGAGSQGMRARIGAGLRWVYGHPRLAPLAWSTHGWFVGSSMLGAVVPVLILAELGVGALGLGMVLTCAGMGAVLGTSVSERLGDRWGAGRTIIAARLAQPAAVALMSLAPVLAGGFAPPGAAGHGHPAGWPLPVWAGFAAVAAGQFLLGLAMGAEGPLEMGYRLAVTPDHLIARTAATMRSANRGMIVVGAPLGGLVATLAGAGAGLLAAAAVMLGSGLVLLGSPFRGARIDERPWEGPGVGGAVTTAESGPAGRPDR